MKCTSFIVDLQEEIKIEAEKYENIVVKQEQDLTQEVSCCYMSVDIIYWAGGHGVTLKHYLPLVLTYITFIAQTVPHIIL